jgi:hypothetical protein
MDEREFYEKLLIDDEPAYWRDVFDLPLADDDAPAWRTVVDALNMLLADRLRKLAIEPSSAWAWDKGERRTYRAAVKSKYARIGRDQIEAFLQTGKLPYRANCGSFFARERAEQALSLARALSVRVDGTVCPICQPKAATVGDALRWLLLDVYDADCLPELCWANK